MENRARFYRNEETEDEEGMPIPLDAFSKEDAMQYLASCLFSEDEDDDLKELRQRTPISDSLKAKIANTEPGFFWGNLQIELTPTGATARYDGHELTFGQAYKNGKGYAIPVAIDGQRAIIPGIGCMEDALPVVTRLLDKIGYSQ